MCSHPGHLRLCRFSQEQGLAELCGGNCGNCGSVRKGTVVNDSCTVSSLAQRVRAVLQGTVARKCSPRDSMTLGTYACAHVIACAPSLTTLLKCSNKGVMGFLFRLRVARQATKNSNTHGYLNWKAVRRHVQRRELFPRVGHVWKARVYTKEAQCAKSSTTSIRIHQVQEFALLGTSRKLGVSAVTSSSIYPHICSFPPIPRMQLTTPVHVFAS